MTFAVNCIMYGIISKASRLLWKEFCLTWKLYKLEAFRNATREQIQAEKDAKQYLVSCEDIESQLVVEASSPDVHIAPEARSSGLSIFFFRDKLLLLEVSPGVPVSTVICCIIRVGANFHQLTEIDKG